jgi:hypothetical protein
VSGGGYSSPRRGSSPVRRTVPKQTYKASPTKEAWSRESKKSLNELRRGIITHRLQETKDVKPRTAPANHPTGNAFFNIGGAASIDLEIPTGKTHATPIASEDLRRAVSILAPVLSGKPHSDEDAKFLADEAGAALFGAPLRVVVPASSHATSIGRTQALDRLLEAATEIENDITRLQNTTGERVRLEAQLFEAQDRVREAQAPGAHDVNADALQQAEKAFQVLQRDYRRIRQTEADERTKLTNTQGAFLKRVKHFNFAP